MHDERFPVCGKVSQLLQQTFDLAVHRYGTTSSRCQLRLDDVRLGAISAHRLKHLHRQFVDVCTGEQHLVGFSNAHGKVRQHVAAVIANRRFGHQAMAQHCVGFVNEQNGTTAVLRLDFTGAADVTRISAGHEAIVLGDHVGNLTQVGLRLLECMQHLPFAFHRKPESLALVIGKAAPVRDRQQLAIACQSGDSAGFV